MLHQALAPAPAPLRPHEYLQLRRRAAGLTVDQVAEHLAPRAAERGACLAFLRLWETPRVIASDGALAQLRRAYPFDPEVYRQLATEPADRHPRVCRGCGCTRWDPCLDGEDCACSWSDDAPDRCTCCARGEAA
jgi:hypothetical protein